MLGTACAEGVELFVTPKDIGVPEAGYTFLYMLSISALYLAVASVLYSTPEINLDPISATSSILGMLTAKSSVDPDGSFIHST